MEIDDFKKLVSNYTEENIISDEPHVGRRCEENAISLDEIKRFILYENKKLVRLVEDRSKVFKLYYHLSRQQEIKIIIDLLTYQKINIRTVKRLTKRFKLGVIKRRF